MGVYFSIYLPEEYVTKEFREEFCKILGDDDDEDLFYENTIGKGILEYEADEVRIWDEIADLLKKHKIPAKAVFGGDYDTRAYDLYSDNQGNLREVPEFADGGSGIPHHEVIPKLNKIMTITDEKARLQAFEIFAEYTLKEYDILTAEDWLQRFNQKSPQYIKKIHNDRINELLIKFDNGEITEDELTLSILEINKERDEKLKELEKETNDEQKQV